jgi:regulator of protease activity HflC (stomatin/prohibitin superfamily)/putative Mn2+ efflux pump MntP
MENENKLKKDIDSGRLMTKRSIITAIGSLIIAIIIGSTGKMGGTDIYSLAIFPYIMVVIFSIAAMIYGIMYAGTARELEEKALLQKRKQGQTFDANEDVRFTTGRSFENYKKYTPYFLAGLGAILTIIIMLMFARSWSLRPPASEIAPSSPQNSAFVSIIFMAISIFAGAFCIGQSRTTAFRWLRPVGAWLIAGFVVSLLAMAAALGHKYHYPNLDRYLRNITFTLYCLLGAEFIINFVTEFYRPRTLEAPRPIFESRLLALFTEPGGVMRNIAETLDYQFGFKVSGSWVYNFAEKSLFKVLIIWLAILWASSMVSEVGPNQLGIKEAFGKKVNEQPLTSGIYFTLPWPFGEIKRYSCTKLQSVIIGPEIGNDKHKSAMVLWTNSHYKTESRYLVATKPTGSHEAKATSVSFMGISMPINFTIRKDELFNYAYNFKDPKSILKNIGEQETVKYLASVSMIDFMGADREKSAKELKKLIQTATDKIHLGIEIVSVNLHDAHPPIKDVAPAYQKVYGAKEKMRATILAADAFKIRTTTIAATEGLKIIEIAKSYRQERVAIADAESKRFNKQLQAYKVMPELYMLRSYLKLMEVNSSHIRKYIMSADMPYSVYELNMEKKTRLDLIDVDLDTLSR